MNFEQLIGVVSNVGFPIFIAMFLLIRIENKIDQLISTFMDLTDAIGELVDGYKEQGNNSK